MLTLQDGIILLVVFAWFMRHVFQLVKNHDGSAYEEDTDVVMPNRKALLFIAAGMYGLYV